MDGQAENNVSVTQWRRNKNTSKVSLQFRCEQALTGGYRQKKKKGRCVFPHLAIVKYVTNISDDVWKLDDFLSALLKLSSYTVAPTDVATHL